jgi:hypothetical protein
MDSGLKLLKHVLTHGVMIQWGSEYKHWMLMVNIRTYINIRKVINLILNNEHYVIVNK